MTSLVPVAMLGWVPVVLLMFWLLPARRAVLLTFLLAWLFLPLKAYKYPMLPEYNKMTAATLGALVGIVLFDFGRVRRFRFQWIDLLIPAWCAVRVGSSLTNGYGAYDGFSAAEYLLLTWGLTWWIGRMYFSDAEGMKELAWGFVIGGLLYVPLCLFEARMSPQLQNWVYGTQFDWQETKRFGGWRPTVFMQHGLMVGMWMCMSALTGWWLWTTGVWRRLWRIPAAWLVPVLLITGVICRSFGAVALLALGMGALWAARKLQRRWVLLAVLALAPGYMALRLSGAWSGANLVEWATQVADADRAGSLASRLNSEDQFIRAGWHQPWLGFRGWYNTQSLQSDEEKAAVPDALWMIEFTGSGLAGLSCLTAYLLWPAARRLWKLSRGDWAKPEMLAGVGLAMVVVLWMMDNLFNGMLNPMYMLAAGALSGGVVWARPGRVARRRASPRAAQAVRAAEARGAAASSGGNAGVRRVR